MARHSMFHGRQRPNFDGKVQGREQACERVQNRNFDYAHAHVVVHAAPDCDPVHLGGPAHNAAGRNHACVGPKHTWVDPTRTWLAPASSHAVAGVVGPTRPHCTKHLADTLAP